MGFALGPYRGLYGLFRQAIWCIFYSHSWGFELGTIHLESTLLRRSYQYTMFVPNKRKSTFGGQALKKHLLLSDLTYLYVTEDNTFRQYFEHKKNVVNNVFLYLAYLWSSNKFFAPKITYPKSSLHWYFSYFLCCFCSTGVYSDYTSSFLLRHQYFFVLFNFSNKKRVRTVLAPPFSLRRAG